MTKTYLISEEVLREVLMHLERDETIIPEKIIHTILAYPPAEPVAWKHYMIHGMYKVTSDKEDAADIPLYVKDL